MLTYISTVFRKVRNIIFTIVLWIIFFDILDFLPRICLRKSLRKDRVWGCSVEKQAPKTCAHRQFCMFSTFTFPYFRFHFLQFWLPSQNLVDFSCLLSRFSFLTAPGSFFPKKRKGGKRRRHPFLFEISCLRAQILHCLIFPRETSMKSEKRENFITLNDTFRNFHFLRILFWRTGVEAPPAGRGGTSARRAVKPQAGPGPDAPPAAQRAAPWKHSIRFF